MPFPLVDCLELWILDRRRKLPLVLVRSQPEEVALPSAARANWTPLSPEDRMFRARSLRVSAADRSRDEGCRSHADMLSSLVMAEAGPRCPAQWFRRRDDGTGEALAGMHLESGLEGRRLQANAFPELLLRSQWSQRWQRSLVRDFFEWQAPMLLTLRSLARSTRAYLERAAAARPLELFRYRKLLPEIVDPDTITPALVEASLRQSAADGAVGDRV